MDNYMRHYHLQEPAGQVDTSFPVRYGHVDIDRPSREAGVLKGLLDRIRPDFYFPLHNCWAGGAFFFSSRDISAGARADIMALLRRLDFPVQNRPLWREICQRFDHGFIEILSIKNYYRYLEKLGQFNESLPRFGAGSWDYLADIKPEAMTFVAEMGYVRHPDDESEAPSGHRLRDLRIDLDTRCKTLARLILDERARVGHLLDTDNAFHRALMGGMVCPTEEGLAAGGSPMSRYPTADILADPRGNAEMSKGDLFNACIVDGGFLFLPTSYQFVRLLKASPQVPEVRASIERLESAFDETLAYIGQYIDFGAFETIDVGTLAEIQLGSGLIALNAVIERRA